MKINDLMPLLTFVLLSLGCGSKRKMAGDAGELLQADLAFARATAEKGLSGWMDFFHPRATIFPAGRPAISGLDSIKSYYKETNFDPSQMKWQPIRAEIASSGDLGFSHGIWEKPGRDRDGREVIYRGKYLTVWGRDVTGRWKVLADIGTN